MEYYTTRDGPRHGVEAGFLGGDRGDKMRRLLLRPSPLVGEVFDISI